jgi:hypothetical protein
MQKNVRVSDLLNTLSEREKVDFQLFIQSSFHTKGVYHEEMNRLLPYLIQDQQTDTFDREKAFLVVFPNQTYVDGKLEKVLSQLHTQLRRFVEYTQMSSPEKEFENKIAQLVFYRTRGLQSRYENLRKQLALELNNLPSDSRNRHYWRFILHYEVSNFEFMTNAKSTYQSIPALFECLEVYYLSVKLELLIQYLIANKITIISLPEEIEDLIAHSYFSELVIDKHPVLLILYQTYRLFEKDDPSPDDFFKIQKLYKENEHKIDPKNYYILNTNVRNYCSLLINSGKSEFRAVLFGIYQEHIEKQYVYVQDKIPASAFNNICHNALVIKEIQWCEKFIEKHRNKILNDTPDLDYYRLAKADLLFYKKEYDAALNVLPTIYANADMLLFARCLELKCYHETKSELLSYKIDAFKMYLSRASKTTISESQRLRNGNFVNLLSQLISTATNDRPRLKKLSEKIKNKPVLAERDWLVEKIIQS